MALSKRGFAVSGAADVAEALILATQNPPEYAVVDLKMPGDSGLRLVTQLKQLDENTRIVMLTGYASIATEIEAIKLGPRITWQTLSKWMKSSPRSIAMTVTPMWA